MASEMTSDMISCLSLCPTRTQDFLGLRTRTPTRTWAESWLRTRARLRTLVCPKTSDTDSDTDILRTRVSAHLCARQFHIFWYQYRSRARTSINRYTHWPILREKPTQERRPRNFKIWTKISKSHGIGYKLLYHGIQRDPLNHWQYSNIWNSPA